MAKLTRLARIVQAMPYDDNTWYHVTERANLPNIAQNGLQPASAGHDRVWGEYPVEDQAVYFFPNASGAFDYPTNAALWQQNPRWKDPVVLRAQGLDRNNLAPDHEMMEGYIDSLHDRWNSRKEWDQMDKEEILIRRWITQWEESHNTNALSPSSDTYIQMLRDMPPMMREFMARRVSEWSNEPVMHYGPVHPDNIQVGDLNVQDENGEWMEKWPDYDEWAESEPDYNEDPEAHERWEEEKDAAFDNWANRQNWVSEDGLGLGESYEDGDNYLDSHFNWEPVAKHHPANSFTKAATAHEEELAQVIEHLDQAFHANDFKTMAQIAHQVQIQAEQGKEYLGKQFAIDRDQFFNFIGHAYVFKDDQGVRLKDKYPDLGSALVDWETALQSLYWDVAGTAKRILDLCAENKLDSFTPGLLDQYMDAQREHLRDSGLWEAGYQAMLNSKDKNWSEMAKDPLRAPQAIDALHELSISQNDPIYKQLKKCEHAVEIIQADIQGMKQKIQAVIQLEKRWTDMGEQAWHDRFDGFYMDDTNRINKPGEMITFNPGAPTTIPENWKIAKTAMAERTGDPELDKLIEEYMQRGYATSDTMGEDVGDEPSWTFDINELRDPNNSLDMCSDISMDFWSFLKGKGVDAQIRESDSSAAGYGGGSPHDWVEVTLPSGTYMIDFTGSQFGEEEFPHVQRLQDGGWQREWGTSTSATVTSMSSTFDCEECGFPLAQNWDDSWRCYECDPTNDNRITWVMDDKGRIFEGGNRSHDEIELPTDFATEIARGEIDWTRDGEPRPSMAVFPGSNLTPEEVAQALNAKFEMTLEWPYAQYDPPTKSWTRKTAEWYEDPDQADWQHGLCDTYAKAMLDMYPHLKLGILYNEDDIEQHYFAHDGKYAYDSIGKHKLPYTGYGENKGTFVQSLEEKPEWYGIGGAYPYGENGSPEDYERAKALIPQQHPWLQ